MSGQTRRVQVTAGNTKCKCLPNLRDPPTIVLKYVAHETVAALGFKRAVRSFSD
jgi:hypothetical protein